MRIQRQKKRMTNELCTEGTPEMDTGALKEEFDFIGIRTHLAHGHR